MASGEADLGLMPLASYATAREELRIVPGIAIASRGPVRTVLLLGDTGTVRGAGGDFEVDEWVEGEAWRKEPDLGVFVIVERR